jgi:hypothetical protein
MWKIHRKRVKEAASTMKAGESPNSPRAPAPIEIVDKRKENKNRGKLTDI